MNIHIYLTGVNQYKYCDTHFFQNIFMCVCWMLLYICLFVNFVFLFLFRLLNVVVTLMKKWENLNEEEMMKFNQITFCLCTLIRFRKLFWQFVKYALRVCFFNNWNKFFCNLSLESYLFVFWCFVVFVEVLSWSWNVCVCMCSGFG
jgi:hypothetical protein